MNDMLTNILLLSGFLAIVLIFLTVILKLKRLKVTNADQKYRPAKAEVQDKPPLTPDLGNVTTRIGENQRDQIDSDGLVVLKKEEGEENFRESKIGDSDMAALFLSVTPLYENVLAQARSNNFTYRHEDDINYAVSLLDMLIEAIEARPSSYRFEGAAYTYRMRADLLVLKAQLNKSQSLLNKAETSYKMALSKGDADPSNIAGCKIGIDNCRKLRTLL